MLTKKKSTWLTALALSLPMLLSVVGVAPAQAAPASSTSLASLTVEGQDALNLSTVDLDVTGLRVSADTLAAEVVAVAQDAANTDVVIEGATSLSLGANTLKVTVSDKEDASVKTVYTKTLNVLNDNNSAIITVALEELINGEYVEVDWGTTSVPVTVSPTDSNATVKVNGTSVSLVDGVAKTTVTGLETGENLVDVVVTAQNGEQDESQLTVLVGQNTDASATFTIDGINVEDGEVVPLDFGVTDPTIDVVTNDPNATFEIVGGSDLISGTNPVTVYVTAEDGVTFERYDFILEVAFDDNANAVITINDVAREDGDIIEVPYKTSSVNISVVTEDADASYEVVGGTNLLQGDNDVQVVVYAPDSVTTITYSFTITVIDPDVTLKTLKVNGTSVADGGSIVSGSVENILLLETTDPLATVTVDGATYDPATGNLTLVPGQNDLTILVTGDDKSTIREYTISVGVWAIDVKWEGLDDAQKAVQSSVLSIVPGSVSAVEVEATVPLDGWSALVEDNNNLNFGNNTVTVTFSGPADQELVVTFTVFVGAADLSLEEFTINDNDVTLDGFSGTVVLDPKSFTGEVVATAKDERAAVVISGGNQFNVGNNTVTVVVTGADGQIATYTVTVVVTPADEAGIDGITLNGLALSDGDLTEIDAGALDVAVDTTDPDATVVVSYASTPDTVGGWTSTANGVTSGAGYLTVTVVVTAENGTTKEEVTFNLLASVDLDVVSGSAKNRDILRVGDLARTTPETVKALYPAYASVAYSWIADGAAISGATAKRYLLTAEDLEREIRPVVSATVSGVQRVYVGKSFTVSKGLIARSSDPVISGSSALGATLTAKPGVWSADVEFAYQWFDNGTAIDGANGETLELSPEEFTVGDVISVSVTGSLEGYENLTRVSSSRTVLFGVLKITEKPELSTDNGYITGTTITVTGGAVNVTSDVDVDYAWYRGSSLVSSQQELSYLTTVADFGKKLSVKITYSRFGFSPVSITLKGLTIKAATLDTPDAAVIAPSQDGMTLLAVGGFSTDAPATSKKYTWFRNGRVVVNQKTDTYRVTAADKGATISVRVVATYLGFLSTSTITVDDESYLVDN